MLWQLLASVLAHPLPVTAVHDERATAAVRAENSAEHEHCADAGMTPAAERAMQPHACQSACKCPCAGTPALAFALPIVAAALPEHPLGVSAFTSLSAPLVANLLRPPIA
jgi:hypothetical protein